MADRLAELNSAILAGSSNTAKLLGQRCTLHIELKEYSEALQDAKALVRLLPDAPAGYLKAARCYRLMSRWKPAQRMLDLATERATEEATLRAVRSETRKLTAAMEEPVPSFIERLPEELFVHALSYLPQPDIIAASHVSQRWRKVIHEGGSQLWHTLVVVDHRGEKNYSKTFEDQAKTFEDQAKFYRARLNGASLESLVIGTAHRHYDFLTRMTEVRPDWHQDLAELLCTAGMVSRLRSLSFFHIHLASTVESLIKAAGHHLQELAFYSADSLAGGFPYLRPSKLLVTCPTLHTLVVRGTAPHVTAGPTAKTVIADVLQRRAPVGMPPIQPSFDQSTPGLRRIHVALCSRATALLLFLETAQVKPLAGIQYASLTCAPGVDMVIPYATPNLRTLVTNDSACFPALADPASPDNQPLTQLETLQLNHMRPARWRLALNLMSSIQSPQMLRCVLIDASASRPTTDNNGETQLKAFFQRHPNIEELSMNKAVPDDFLVLLPHLGKLKRLSVSHATLPEKFLEQAAIHLKGLESLDVSGSTNITSGPLLRLVKARDGQMKELGIEGCNDLIVEAVDWLRKAVPSLKWSGWKDKTEARAFKFHA